MSTSDEDRIVVESGQEAAIARIVAPVLTGLGFRLVRVKLSQRDGATLQVMAERPDGSMSVEDCEFVSRALSPVLDVEDPLPQTYHLELSSPGIDRPLVRRSDFRTGTGHVARIETSQLLDGRKRFKGEIAAVSDEAVTLAAHDGEPEYTIPFSAIASARLVLSEALIRQALRRDKAARQAAKKHRKPKTEMNPPAGRTGRANGKSEE